MASVAVNVLLTEPMGNLESLVMPGPPPRSATPNSTAWHLSSYRIASWAPGTMLSRASFAKLRNTLSISITALIDRVPNVEFHAASTGRQVGKRRRLDIALVGPPGGVPPRRSTRYLK